MQWLYANSISTCKTSLRFQSGAFTYEWGEKCSVTEPFMCELLNDISKRLARDANTSQTKIYIISSMPNILDQLADSTPCDVRCSDELQPIGEQVIGWRAHTQQKYQWLAGMVIGSLAPPSEYANTIGYESHISLAVQIYHWSIRWQISWMMRLAYVPLNVFRAIISYCCLWLCVSEVDHHFTSIQ